MRSFARRESLYLVALIAILTHVDALPAQPAEAVERGARVRILAPAWRARPTVGRLDTVQPDALLFTPTRTDSLVRLPWSHITRFEVSAGRNKRRGRALGALLGFSTFVVGGLVCLYVCPTDPDDGANLAPVGGVLYGVVVGIPAGALLGGRYLPTDRWRPVPLSATGRP